MKKTLITALVSLLSVSLNAQIVNISTRDTMCGHKIYHDAEQRI